MSTSLRAALAALLIIVGIPGAAAPQTAAGTGARELDNCSWNRPGVDPFMGDVVAAVDRYRDIPPPVRERLKARMAKRDYDDIVSIQRDSINGRVEGRSYAPTISEMHFGTGQVCRSVTRAAWSPTMQERGLVYCESGQCILVPTVCRNVSRISRREVSPDHAVGPGGADLAEAPAVAEPLALDRFPNFGAPLADAVVAGGDGPGGPGDFGNHALGTGDRGVSGIGFAGAALGGAGGGGRGAGGTSSLPLASVGGRDVAPPVTPVPEPETWALLALGLGAVALVRRRRSAAAQRAIRRS